jgi:hypothetical protein
MESSEINGRLWYWYDGWRGGRGRGVVSWRWGYDKTVGQGKAADSFRRRDLLLCPSRSALDRTIP